MNIFEKMVSMNKALQDGVVICKTCGKLLKVDSGKCLANGWPKCCGATMSLGRAFETTIELDPSSVKEPEAEK